MPDALRRGEPADQRDDVVRGRAGRLVDDQDPVQARARATSAPRPRPGAGRRRRADGPRRRRHPAPRPREPSKLAPDARACPPPPNAPVRTVASTPPGFVRTLIRVAGPASLNRMATSAVSDCERRSMMPSEWARIAPGRLDVGVGQRGPHDPALVRALEAVQDPPEQAQLGLGLRPIELARDVRERRAGVHERRGHRERPGRGVRMGEGRGVHDDAGHQVRREGAVVGGRAARRGGPPAGPPSRTWPRNAARSSRRPRPRRWTRGDRR